MCHTLSYRGRSLCPPPHTAVASRSLASGNTGGGQALELTFCALASAAPWGWGQGQRQGPKLGRCWVRKMYVNIGEPPLSKSDTYNQIANKSSSSLCYSELCGHLKYGEVLKSKIN